MLKKARNIFAILCMIVAMNIPMAVQAGGDELIINSYATLKEVLETDIEEEYMDCYLEPNGFIWPEEEITVNITDNISVGAGTWNIPKNITIEFPARKVSWSWDGKSNLEVAGKVIIDSDHSISGVDIAVEKGGCIEGKDWTALYVGKNEKLTLRDGATLDVRIRLDGTLTGDGTVTNRIEVRGGYMGTDSNAVISGNVKCKEIAINGDSIDYEGDVPVKGTLTIPNGSNVEIERILMNGGDSEATLNICEGSNVDIKTCGLNGSNKKYGKATINLNGNLNITGWWLGVGKNGKIVMNDGKLTIKPEGTTGLDGTNGEVDTYIFGTGIVYLEASIDENGNIIDSPSFFGLDVRNLENPDQLAIAYRFIEEGIVLTSNACTIDSCRHNWKYELIKEPTYTANGEMVRTCLKCDKKIYQVIDKLKEEPSKNDNNTQGKIPKKGTVLTHKSSKGKYVVSSTSKTNPTVTYKQTTNKKAKNITIPATITVKGITYKVTAIADNAFKNNKKVTKVTVGKNITQIGKNAFYGCKNLKNIVVKSTKLKKVGKNTFKGIHAKAKIQVPSKKLSDYKKLLKDKGQGKKVKISK